MPYKDKDKQKSYNKKYRENHKEERKKYREDHKKEKKESDKKYWENHKEEKKAYNEKYKEEHPEEIKEYKKQYSKEHTEEIREYNKKYREKHKKESKEYSEKYNDDHKIDIICLNCGQPAKAFKKDGKFCSHSCSGKYYSGPKNPNWLGGISFEPYCPKFNNDLRRRIRSFFNYECVLCGKTAEENRSRQLSCHHVMYNKMSCCDGKPVHFAALCIFCHNKTNGNQENRERWESMLHRIIDEIYDGKSYFTKEEWKNRA